MSMLAKSITLREQRTIKKKIEENLQNAVVSPSEFREFKKYSH